MSKKQVIFDDKYSFLHSFLGVILRIGAIEGLIGKVCSVIALTAFLIRANNWIRFNRYSLNLIL